MEFPHRSKPTFIPPSLWSRYPFERMKVGAHVSIDPKTYYISVPSIRSAVFYHAKKAGKNFMTRVDKKTGYLHIWRLS